MSIMVDDGRMVDAVIHSGLSGHGYVEEHVSGGDTCNIYFVQLY